MSWQKRILNIRLCWAVLTVFCFFSLIPPNAEAFLVQSRLSSGELISERTDQIATIQSVLEQKIVSQRLQDYGLSKAEVMAKLDTMSDAQLQQLAGLSGDVGGGDAIGAAIGILLVILLVVVILRLSDRRIVIQ